MEQQFDFAYGSGTIPMTVKAAKIDVIESVTPAPIDDLAKAFRRAVEEDELSAQESMRLLFTREQSVRLWRALSAAVPEGRPSVLPTLPLYRSLASAMGGSESFLRTVFALEVFRERGLLEQSEEGGNLTLRITPTKEKVDLLQSPYVRRLQGSENLTNGT